MRDCWSRSKNGSLVPLPLFGSGASVPFAGGALWAVDDVTTLPAVQKQAFLDLPPGEGFLW